MKNRLFTFKETSRLLMVMLLGIGLTSSFYGCNPDEGGTPSTDDGGSTDQEYLIINGQRFEGKDFHRKLYKSTNSQEFIRVELGPNYPLVEITHGKKQPENVGLLARDYEPSKFAGTDPEFDEYTVKIFFAHAPPPNDCQYFSLDNPSPAHATYTLKKVNGKWVSEFGKAQLGCNNKPANGDDQIAVEGYVIWEDKN